MLTRIRIISDGRVTVSTVTHSQIVEFLRDVDADARAAFRRGESITLPDGSSIKRVATV